MDTGDLRTWELILCHRECQGAESWVSHMLTPVGLPCEGGAFFSSMEAAGEKTGHLFVP